MKFFEVFNRLCNEKGMSPNAVCKALGLSNATYTKWKQEDSTPRQTTLIKVADYFDVPVDYLLGVEDQNAALMRVAIETLDEDTLAEQEKTLLAMFRTTSEEGRLRIIQAVMNIHDEEEKKSATTAEEVVG